MGDVFVSESTQADSEPCPAGMQRGICAFVEDIGEEEFNGKVRPKVVLCFESEKLMDDGRPYMISKTYSRTLGTADYPSDLRKLLVGWRGRDFTPEELAKFNLNVLVGKNCTLNIVHVKKKKGNGMRAELSAVMPSMPGVLPLNVVNKDPPKWIAKQKDTNEAASRARAARGADTLASDAADPPGEWDNIPTGGESETPF